MNKEEIIQGEKQYVLHTYNRPEVVFTKGEGVYTIFADFTQRLSPVSSRYKSAG